MTFTVRVSGAQRMRAAPWGVTARAWADRVLPVAEQALRDKAPVSPVGGGRLRHSITGRVSVAASRATITFTAVDYARYVIDGTRPHEIRPKTKKALWWEGAQNPVAVVHHPGTRPDDFVRRALTPLHADIQAALNEAMAAAVKP